MKPEVITTIKVTLTIEQYAAFKATCDKMQVSTAVRDCAMAAWVGATWPDAPERRGRGKRKGDGAKG